MTPDSILSLVAPEVIGCPEPIILSAIMESASEFCRESLAWQVDLDMVALVDGQAQYTIEPPSGSYVLTVIRANIGAMLLKAASEDEAFAFSGQTSELPWLFELSGDKLSVSLIPAPAGASGKQLKLKVALAPTAAEKTLPDFLGRGWSDVIASGAKAALMLMPPGESTPWSNHSSAAYYRQRFDSGINRAQIERVYRRLPGELTVAPRRFGF